MSCGEPCRVRAGETWLRSAWLRSAWLTEGTGADEGSAEFGEALADL